MPIGYMGYSLSRAADRQARNAEREQQPEIEPLPPGVDPLEALDPETRELVTSLEPVAVEQEEPGFGDRVEGALIGAGVGAFAGVVLVNWQPRSARWRGAAPMDAHMTMLGAVVGAAIGGIAGFARAGDPIDRPAEAKVQPLLAATSGAQVVSHPAFASLHTG